MSLKKPKNILWNILIRHNLPLGKSKKIKWGFLKMANILNTLLSITIW